MRPSAVSAVPFALRFTVVHCAVALSPARRAAESPRRRGGWLVAKDHSTVLLAALATPLP
jgi:hypothetical protein